MKFNSSLDATSLRDLRAATNALRDRDRQCVCDNGVGTRTDHRDLSLVNAVKQCWKASESY
jgi:hypothetical protein